MEQVAVVRVHRRGDARHPCCQPTEHSRLRLVRVHDVGLEAAERRRDPRQRLGLASPYIHGNTNEQPAKNMARLLVSLREPRSASEALEAIAIVEPASFGVGGFDDLR